MKAHVERIEQAEERRDWRSSISVELASVEETLADALGSDVLTVWEVSKHLLSAGGKRLRPGLVILGANACGGAEKTRISAIAASVELIHMASLVHDDVLDGSSRRRGRVTANTFWGNKVSVLTGDFMLSKAFKLLSSDGDGSVMRVMADITIRMAESEVLQAVSEHDVDAWRENYFQIIRHKTAGFMAGCSRCGAIIAGATELQQKALEDFGMELGLAFQLTDDILDLVGDPEVTGKPRGSDIRDGKVTLPVLLGLDCLSDTEREWAYALLSNESPSPEDVDSFCDAIAATGAVEIARERARTHAERAAAALSELPETSARETMAQMALRMCNRVQ